VTLKEQYLSQGACPLQSGNDFSLQQSPNGQPLSVAAYSSCLHVD
jgi:hypothetical protein